LFACDFLVQPIISSLLHILILLLMMKIVHGVDYGYADSSETVTLEQKLA